ncbi:tetratricopeptide repeat protein 27-like protein [Iris pallida]|uniref:Tetratricopeptide repeat protein 27-like protein n=1 Tax=Iris pallida TaxID=29817 RepID=A0AAX6DM75_IRIPA|nr:tetratricopeptide repeat protein 27-like protein [Iris pallida]
MAEETLKSTELRLLRCTLSSPNPPPNPNPNPNPLLESLLVSIEQGNYRDALSSPEVLQLLFPFAERFDFADSVESAGRFYAEVERSVEAFLLAALGGEADAWMSVLGSREEEREMEGDVGWRFGAVMCLGVAAFFVFTQQNVTGPVGDFSPFPLSSLRSKEKTIDGGGQWDIWATGQVTSVGCHLLGKISHLQYMVFAKILLSKAKDLCMRGRESCLSGTKSISWWLCRLIFLQQRILDELSSSLYDLLQVYKNETLSQFGELKNVVDYWGSVLHNGEAVEIVSMAQLEAGIVEYKYCRVDSSRLHLSRAEEACGLQLSLTGVLGFRTVHQVDAKPQLVLVANNDHYINGGECSAEGLQVQTESSACEEGRNSQANEHYESCDILMTPRLVENDGECNGNIANAGKTNVLTPIQQAIVLAECLHLKRRSREDELSRWEMAPYIEAIDSQQQSYYIVRCFCDILRVQWESTRSRTKERALIMMEKLVEAVNKVFPVAAQRIRLSYGIYLPTIPALRKEHGELLVSCGLVREALKIFEDLELWDNLIYCYRLLDKKTAAVDLIRARLDIVPTDPRLWCSLGDVTNTDAHYEKALEVSNNRSARAKRSLARSAYNRGEYEKSKIFWESAMAINSLYPDGWFALGAAALKARDIDKALDGFTRAVQLDPDNGEAWNNIACVHMMKKNSKPAFVAFKEALKFRRNSWQLWENFSQVALDIGNFSQALEATKMVLDLSKNKQVDVELLDTVMRKVEESTSNSAVFSTQDAGGNEVTSEESRENELLMDMLGNILTQVVRNGGGNDIWGIYARWHKIKGNLTVCSEALLKQVRSYQGSDLWHDRDRFKKFAHASLQLCKVYMEIALTNKSHRELKTAEMHLRNSVKQAVDFSDMEEFKDLQACLEEVKMQLNAASNEGA